MEPFAFEVDTDTFRDVVQAVGAEEMGAFVTSLVAEIEQLRGHLIAGGSPEALDALGREAHHLSGGCRSLGFTGVGALCARIEADARERVDRKWPAYSDELAQQRKALSEWWSTASTDPRLMGS